MEYRKLGNLDVSVIGLGTLRTFDVADEAGIGVRQQIIDNCLDQGINFIDSAWMYGEAESVIGRTTAGKRDKFYLAIKRRQRGHGHRVTAVGSGVSPGALPILSAGQVSESALDRFLGLFVNKVRPQRQLLARRRVGETRERQTDHGKSAIRMHDSLVSSRNLL